MKRLRDQGLPAKHLNTVFQAIISHLLYAIPSWGCYLTAELTGKIDAFLRRAHHYGFAANIQTVSELLDKGAQDLFKKLQSHDHCLNNILPEEKSLGLALRPRGHRFQLPSCVFKDFKLSFINHCLFKYR